MSWHITVTGEFCSAHALRNYQGKCENLHGHNFKVQATVKGDQLDDKTGMLLDFTVFKHALRDILEKMDHQILGELPPFDCINPSSENLSRHIWMELEKFLAMQSNPTPVTLHSVTVSEKETQWATYFGPNPD